MLAILFVTTQTTANKLDNNTIYWYNTRMATDTPSISDSLSRINLVTDSHNRGFTMTFDNRVTVSIRWGTFNYSDRTTTAEVAAWNADTHDWVRVPGFGDYSQVMGHLTTNDVARFIYNASTMTL